MHEKIVSERSFIQNEVFLVKRGTDVIQSHFFFITLHLDMKECNTILTITGSDSTGGSGVQADIKLISQLGGYAVSAITSITVQNTLGIQQFFDLPAQVVSGQIEAIINDVQPQIVKIGMVRRVDVLNVIIETLSKYRPRYIIYDPIIYSSKGERLMDDDVVSQIRQRLLPICTLVIEECHKTHGESNAYASAIAVYLSQGDNLEEAQNKARNFVTELENRHLGLQGRSQELYGEFIRQLEQHLYTNSDVAFYADCLNVSPRYLAQVCKREGKQSPKQIIDSHLLHEIEKELDSTRKTVQQIAYDFGFSSQAHFAKFFKNLEGMTPSEYRKK